MKFITINRNKFMKVKLPVECHDNNPTFINKLTNLLLYQYTEYKTELKLFTKKKAPFLIGFNGSVSSGKSFIADKCATRLKECGLSVAILSTDNFIYPNRELEAKKIMHRKGFPESYDIKRLLRTLDDIKAGKSVMTPLYDQSISDISAKKHKIKKNLDIVLIEGINILQPILSKYVGLLLSDYLDYSIYIDAPERYLKQWFYKRLNKKRTRWKRQGIRQNLTRKNKQQFRKWAMDIWKQTNKVNLDKYILPFKERANLIIFKNKNHKVKEIAIRI